MKEKADVGLIGLAVMGENLVMNMEDKGFHVVVFNRTLDKVDNFINGRAKGKNIIGVHSLSKLCNSLERPRKVILLVKAGQPVDDYIEQLLGLLEPGDVIIDSGNSNYLDTIRRTQYVESRGLLFVGTGISGGEEGALKGPSMMPGGSPEAWPLIKDLFQKVCAKVNNAEPCADWIGRNGAGHFVKMVHNGIEYGDMQLICEAYHLMKNMLLMSNEEMHEVFFRWNKGELNSYLIEITSEILEKKDSEGLFILDKILDSAGQKGTGKWTGIASLEEGVPLTLISEAVYARCLSAMKEERVVANKEYQIERKSYTENKEQMIEWIGQALLASKIISYAQGFALMNAASKKHGWELNFGQIALLWRGGCIIRSSFLGKIRDAYERNFKLENLLLDPYFKKIMQSLITPWRNVVSKAISCAIPIPTFSSALSYFDGYTSDRLPANLLQAQRDYFGAHTYERIDSPRGEFFHTNWTGDGGNTAATSYTV